MRCTECELENAEGVFYCARCHVNLPRPLAPGECPYCGHIPEPQEHRTEICLSCGNDVERGMEVRRLRVARLLGEAAWQQQAMEAQLKKPTDRRAFGCLPLLAVMIFGIGTSVRAKPPADGKERNQWLRFDRCDSVSKSPKTFSRSPKR